MQFYLDAPDSFRIEAHAEFLYGEYKVTPFVPSPAGLLRDVRAESRAKRLLASYLQPGVGGREEVYGTADEDEIYRMLEEGVPALLAENGTFIASGIIDTRRDEVADGLRAAGLEVVEIREENGWECILCRHPRA